MGEIADLAQSARNLILQVGGIGFLVGVVIGADFRGNGEARRDRQAQIAHLGQIGALAAQEIFHPGLALGLAVPERINPLCHTLTAFYFRKVANLMHGRAQRRQKMEPVLPDFGLRRIHFDGVKSIHRATQSRHVTHGASKVFARQGGRDFGLGL